MSTATVLPFDGTRRFNSEAEATAVCPAGWSVRKTTRGSRYQCDPPPGLHVGKAPPKVVSAKALAEKPRYQLIGADELSKGTSGRSLVQHAIGAASLVVFNGSPGVGKSTFTLGLCDAATRGVEFFGKKTRPCKVVYWIGEGRSAVNGCMRVYREHFGRTCDQLPKFITESYDAREPKQLAELINAIGKCDIFVIDTLSSALPSGDQNSSADMGAFVSACQLITKHTGATVIALHHPTKSDETNLRGSGVLLGAADTVIQIARQGDYRTASILKQKSGVEGPWCNFKIVPYVVGQDEWGDEQTAVVVEAYTGPTKATKERTRPSGRHQTAIYSVLETMAPSGTVDYEDLIAGYVAKMPKSPGKDRRPADGKRALEGLIASRLAFMHEDDRVSLTSLVTSGGDEWLG